MTVVVTTWSIPCRHVHSQEVIYYIYMHLYKQMSVQTDRCALRFIVTSESTLRLPQALIAAALAEAPSCLPFRTTQLVGNVFGFAFRFGTFTRGWLLLRRSKSKEGENASSGDCRREAKHVPHHVVGRLHGSVYDCSRLPSWSAEWHCSPQGRLERLPTSEAEHLPRTSTRHSLSGTELRTITILTHPDRNTQIPTVPW